MRQNSDSDQKNKPCEHVIDCGDIVWSLAFGSSVPEKQSRCVNIEWHRFKFGQDQLLLATGLSNGRIKIWDVYTGKKHTNIHLFILIVFLGVWRNSNTMLETAPFLPLEPAARDQNNGEAASVGWHL